MVDPLKTVEKWIIAIILISFGLMITLTFLGPKIGLIVRIVMLTNLTHPLFLYMSLPFIIAVSLPRLLMLLSDNNPSLTDDNPSPINTVGLCLLLGVVCFSLTFVSMTRLHALAIIENNDFVDANVQYDAPLSDITNELWLSLSVPPAWRNLCFTGDSEICALADRLKANYRSFSWRENTTHLWKASYVAIFVLSITTALLSPALYLYYFLENEAMLWALFILLIVAIVSLNAL